MSPGDVEFGWSDEEPEPVTAPVHPAAKFGSHAIRLFEEVVEQTTVRKRATKTSDRLVNEGLLYDRHVGTDEYGQDIFEFSARIEAWEMYAAYLDMLDASAEPAVNPTP